MEFDIKGMV